MPMKLQGTLSTLKFPTKNATKKGRLQKVKLKINLPQIKPANEIKIDFGKYEKAKEKY